MIEQKPKERPFQQQFITQFNENALDDPQRWAQIAGDQIYIIRKQTISHANQQLNKKLSKQYQLSKIQYRKKSALLKDQRERVTYDYQNYPQKKQMYSLRQIFAKQSKSNQLMKQNHEKIKKRVQRISKLIQTQDNLNIKEGDIAKYTFKMAADVQVQPRPTQKPDINRH